MLSLIGVAFFGVRLLRRLKRRDALRLGYDGELATGQELNELLLRGCRVFHDVPAEGFNIDHVVVGPAGVFAVETKARAKPPKGSGSEAVKVVYDGETLRFPGFEVRDSLEQAKRQAKWLGRWLTEAVGERLEVKPALALPGWFVERRASNGLIVFNPKNAVFLAEPRGEAPLPKTSIQRIAHQLEQRCRNVEPKAYRRRSE